MAKKFKSFREESKTNWGITLEENESLTNDQLQTGALLRIADASEKMAVRYQELHDELERYKNYYKSQRIRSDSLYKTISNMKGQITKLKKKLVAKN